MKFTCQAGALALALSRLTPALRANPTVPILENVHLLLDEDGVLHLTTSDLQIVLQTTLPVEEAKAGKLCLPHDKLLGLLTELKGTVITLTETEGWCAEIHQGRRRYQVAGEDPTDFPRTPPTPKGPALELEAAGLRRALKLTLPFISTDELRVAMACLALDVADGGLRLVATNGNALTYEDVTTSSSEVPPMPEGSASARPYCMSRLAAMTLSRSLPKDGPVTLRMGKSTMEMTTEQLTLITVLTDEVYPDYRNVMPPKGDELRLDREGLLGALRRTALLMQGMSNSKGEMIDAQARLTITKDQLEVSAENNVYNHQADETLDAEYGGKPLEIGFKIQYLTTVLSAFEGEEIILRVTAPNRAGILVDPTSPGRYALIMPVMLSERHTQPA